MKNDFLAPMIFAFAVLAAVASWPLFVKRPAVAATSLKPARAGMAQPSQHQPGTGEVDRQSRVKAE